MSDAKPQEQNAPAQSVTCRQSREYLLRYYVAPGVGAILLGAWCFFESFILKKYPYKPFAEDLNAWASWAFNFYCGILLPLIGLGIVSLGLWRRRMPVVADEKGIGYAGKAPLAWETIETVDATALKEKGRLTITAKDGETLTLIDWKWTNFRDLLILLESHVSADKIQRT